MFPFSVRGSINIETTKAYSPELEQAVLNCIHDRLLKEKPQGVKVDQNRLLFKRGFPRLSPKPKLLDYIERGSISIEPKGQGLTVKYELWFMWMIIPVLLIILLNSLISISDGGFIDSLLLGLIVFLIIMAGYILFAVTGFRNMLKWEIGKVV